MRQVVKAVDLFCGAGGLTKGLERAGIDVRLGMDIDPACAYPYEANNRARFLLRPVEKVSAQEVLNAMDGAPFRLLAGCAPCQPFSTYSQGKADRPDRRWHLLRWFAYLIGRTMPELVTVENVPRLVQHEIFDEFVAQLTRWTFKVFYRTVNSADYGVPQKRQRLVLLASRLGPIELISPTHDPERYSTVRDAIGDLPPIKAGETHEDDPLHKASSLSAANEKRIKASRPGGSWRDWDEGLVAECHKKVSGKTYPSVYGRMSWDEPAPTVTTQFFGFGNGRFGHPEQDRAISLREGAILQSFPRNYKFARPDEPVSRESIARLIGNAVPVRLGQAIGKSVLRHVAKYEPP